MSPDNISEKNIKIINIGNNLDENEIKKSKIKIINIKPP